MTPKATSLLSSPANLCQGPQEQPRDLLQDSQDLAPSCVPGDDFLQRKETKQNQQREEADGLCPEGTRHKRPRILSP